MSGIRCRCSWSLQAPDRESAALWLQCSLDERLCSDEVSLRWLSGLCSAGTSCRETTGEHPTSRLQLWSVRVQSVNLIILHFFTLNPIIPPPPVLPSSQPVQDYVEAFKGDQVSLQCNITGDPPPSISWLFRGEQLTSNLYYKLLANGTLVITSMIASLDGQYVCVAENLMGSTNASITVEYRGKWQSTCNLDHWHLW